MLLWDVVNFVELSLAVTGFRVAFDLPRDDADNRVIGIFDLAF